MGTFDWAAVHSAFPVTVPYAWYFQCVTVYN